MISGGHKNKGFFKVELDVVRFAELVELEHIVSEVEVSKELVGVIMVREAIKAAEMVSISAIGNVLIDACEYQV
jgi:hypothetical protein